MNAEPKYKPMSVKEFAVRWEVSPSTVRRWLKRFEAEIGPRVGNIYNPKQVEIILSKLE